MNNHPHLVSALNPLLLCLGLIMSVTVLGQEKKPGDMIWEFHVDNIMNSPAIGSNGTIYVGSGDGNLYAINPNGKRKWKFKAGRAAEFGPTVGSDGTVYVGSGRTVYAISPNGTKKWQFETESSLGNEGAPAIGIDGTVYIHTWGNSGRSHFHTLNRDGSQRGHRSVFLEGGFAPSIGIDGTIYIPQRSRHINIQRPNEYQKWEVAGSNINLTPLAIGSDGTVYVGTSEKKVYALDRNTGAKKWVFLANGWSNYCPVIGSDGTVFVVSGKTVCAINGATGSKKWDSVIGDYMLSSPVIGNDGTIYVVSRDKKIHALAGNTGEKQWEVNTRAIPERSPVIGSDGTLYVGLGNSLLALKTSSTGLANSPWPMLRRNARRTGFALDYDSTNPDIFIGGIYANGKKVDKTESTTVEFRSTFQEGEIFYTLDGTKPTFTSTPYSAPFQLTESSTIRVIAYSSDFIESVEAEPATLRILPTYFLTISGAGGGTVTIDPPDGPYLEGTEVTLTATPEGEWDFIGWSGDFTSSDATITVTMNGPKTLKATFGTNVTVNGIGGGKVIQTPPNPVPYGSTVSFRAVPDDGNYFFRWAGEKKGSGNPTQLQIIKPNSVVSALFAVPTPGDRIWEIQIGDKFQSSPAIGSNGTIYVGSRATKSTGLYAINPNGTKKWEFEIGRSFESSPTVSDDGTIYFCSHNKLYALNTDGTNKWEIETDSSCWGSPALGKDGTIYISIKASNSEWWEGKIYAISPDGTIKWGFQPQKSTMISSPSIGTDGTIYVGSSEYRVYALNPNGTIKWHFQTLGITSPPSIGIDGTVYVGSNHVSHEVYAIHSNGTLKWKHSAENGVSAPTIGNDGILYVNSSSLSSTINPGNVFAISPEGIKKWTFKASMPVRSSPAIGNDGTLYFGLSGHQSIGDAAKVYAVNPDGTKQWEFETGHDISSAPAIGNNGILYVTSRDGKLYAIKTSSTGPADSPWPMFGQNAQRTGRAPSPVSDALQITIPNKTASPFTISFTTAEGSTYVFQASGDLKNWSKVEEVNGTGGEVKVTDRREALFKKQYYRVKLAE
jgi:outer membrane protein assembly factor BamB